MKMKAILAASLLAVSSSAAAGETVELTANQMDGVTAGAASGLAFNLNAAGENFAATQISAVTGAQALAEIENQLTTITPTQSFVGGPQNEDGESVGASGFAQAN